MASSGPNVGQQSAKLPAIDEQVDVIDLFRAYQESCRLRLDACGNDPGLRLGALEPLVNELLQQNEMLIQSISQLQETKICAMHADGNGERRSAGGGQKDDHQLQQVTEIGDSGHVSAAEVIRELNSHLTSLQIENNNLRDKNDNLEHDIENLLDMMEFERNARTARDGIPDHDNDQSQIGSHCGVPALKAPISCKLLTFCDSLTPEDVYGPIESHSQSRETRSESNEALANGAGGRRANGTGSRENESAANGTSPETKNQSLKSLDDGSSSGKDSGVGSSVTVPKPTVLTSASSCSLASSNQQLLLEEKDLLIADLQQHLESLTLQVQLADKVIKKVEIKLTEKRKECNEWRGKAFEWQRKLNHHVKENMELKEQILTLNDHKRCLMTRLDAESEACQSAREELVLLRRRSSQLLQQTDFQSMTIEHLKEAIMTKTRALSTLSSSTTSLSRLQPSSATIHL